MPNYCQNTLYVSHENHAEIKRLLAEISKNEPALFDAIRPTPPELLKKGWYEWRLEHWGTKWNPLIMEYEMEEAGNLKIYFDTAWAPPVELYEFMTTQGFKIEAHYSEEGMCFRGTYTSEHGDDCEPYLPDDCDNE